ncbi:hypothetical protein PGTUg99_010619 [Puccinia graminis f. sp. tritici]|uniref:Uncharacterized protein n=1 Tax=Puccinia graminis f. sp. tritici TaxID=56615 RepID=A0A5B0RTU8_PUCGR|nr:hypothetical protein PGTUg99_010619 [Puccinia graminis f. sp. tritici]
MARFAWVLSLLLTSFLVAPGIRGPPTGPYRYTDRCERCWQAAGSPTDFMNTMYKTVRYNSYPCNAFGHDLTCRQKFAVQGYYCVGCCNLVHVSLGRCPTHGQSTQYIPEPRLDIPPAPRPAAP